MSMNVDDRKRAYAGLGEVALGTAAFAATRSLGPTMMNEAGKFNRALAIQSGAAGLAVGLIGEGVARGLDAATPLDRLQSHLALGAAGLGVMLIGRHFDHNTVKLVGSTGRILAITGTVGAALDVAHERFDKDGDGHFFPKVPWQAELAIGGVLVGGAALKFGPKIATIVRNSKQLAGSAAEMDAAGAQLNELIPRSKLTTGPQIFLGSRIQHGHGASAIRTVVPHKLDAPELRTSLGLPASGNLAHEQLASIGPRSLEQQGAFALDDAGRPMVDVILEGSPTGMGGLNTAPVMMSEQLLRTATIDAQYGAKPSVQSLHKVGDAIDQFVAVSRATRDRVAKMPEGARPPRFGIATSLGGLQFDELIKRHGHGIIDELGLEKIITLGAPSKLSKLDPSTLPDGFHFRGSFEEFAELSDDQVKRVRFIEISHADDPVPLTSFQMLYRRPDWISRDRTWGVGVSFLQHMSDVTKSISQGTGPVVTNGGHEYRQVKALEAFMRALSVTDANGAPFSPDALRSAAVRAQDTAVSEAKRLREALLGRTDLRKPATPPAPPVTPTP